MAYAARRKGLGADPGIVGGLLSFIPQLATSIGQAVPTIEAASGVKSAQEYETQQAQLGIAQANAAAAPYTAATNQANALANALTNALPWVAGTFLGLGVLGLAAAVISRKKANPRRRRSTSVRTPFGVMRRVA